MFNHSGEQNQGSLSQAEVDELMEKTGTKPEDFTTEISSEKKLGLGKKPSKTKPIAESTPLMTQEEIDKLFQ